MKAFTYSIREISTGRWYYGVRYAEDCSLTDLFTTYFTSSSILEPLIRNAPHEFTYKIKRKFDCKLKAQEWEAKFLKRTRAAKHPKSFNKHHSGAPPIMFGDDNPSTRAEVKEKLRAAALRRGPQTEATIRKMRTTILKRSIVNAFRNKNFKVSKSDATINQYENYLSFMYEHKPRCKHIIHFLIGLLNECKNFVKKKYPKNRRSSPRGKIQAISNSKIGAKWFTSPDLLTAKPFHDLTTVPPGWIPGIKLASRNNIIGNATRKRFTT